MLPLPCGIKVLVIGLGMGGVTWRAIQPNKTQVLTMLNEEANSPFEITIRHGIAEPDEEGQQHEGKTARACHDLYLNFIERYQPDVLCVGSRGGKFAEWLLKERKWRRGLAFFGSVKLRECCQHAAAYQRFVVVHGSRDGSQQLDSIAQAVMQERGGEHRHTLIEMTGCNHSLYNQDAIERYGVQAMGSESASDDEKGAASAKVEALSAEEKGNINPWYGEDGKRLMSRILYQAHRSYVDSLTELMARHA